MEPEPSTSRTIKDFVSPVKKRPRRGSSLSEMEKNMVLNGYKHVYHNWPANKYWSKVDCAKEAAQLLGVAVSSVYAVVKEYKENDILSPPKKPGPKLNIIDKLDEFTMCAIRRIIHQFFFRNEPPTIKKIHEKLCEDPDLPHFSMSTLRKVLCHLQFKYTSRKRRSNLIERRDIIVWRQRYLMKISEFRNEGRHIYYQDETWVNEGHTVSKTWVDGTINHPRQAFLEGLTTGLKSPTGKGRRLIISHIGSEEGFLDDGLLMFESKKGTEDYHKEMNAVCFEEWFGKILANVKNNSVIVIDNAPYHSRKAAKAPNTKTKKADIQKWLKDRNIEFTPNMVIATLLELVSKVKDRYETKVVDEMAAARGVTVLRLPPYHCELNPLELIWAQVKGHVARNNTNFKIAAVQKLFMEGLQNVTRENWTAAIEHVKKEEEKMLALDHLIDDVNQSFIINVSSGESDSSTDVTDTSDSD